MATEIESKVEILQDISAKLSGELQSIQRTRSKARAEVDGDGLTLETCNQLSNQMFLAENKARRLYTGLLSVHQSMAVFVPEGLSEGSKDWPP